MQPALELALREVDEELGVHAVFFTVPSPNVSYVMSVLESYESLGVTRSHDPLRSDGRVLMVAMIVPDFAAVARVVLDELAAAADLDFIETTAELIADLRAILADA